MSYYACFVVVISWSANGMIVRREIWNERESATEMMLTVHGAMNMRRIAQSP